MAAAARRAICRRSKSSDRKRAWTLGTSRAARRRNTLNSRKKTSPPTPPADHDRALRMHSSATSPPSWRDAGAPRVAGDRRTEGVTRCALRADLPTSARRVAARDVPLRGDAALDPAVEIPISTQQERDRKRGRNLGVCATLSRAPCRSAVETPINERQHSKERMRKKADVPAKAKHDRRNDKWITEQVQEPRRPFDADVLPAATPKSAITSMLSVHLDGDRRRQLSSSNGLPPCSGSVALAERFVAPS